MTILHIYCVQRIGPANPHWDSIHIIGTPIEYGPVIHFLWGTIF